jgi:hypothetical protein
VSSLLVDSAIIPYGSVAFAQQSQNTTKPLANTTSNTNTTGATTNKTALLKPGNTALNTAVLDVRMLQLTFSNKPKDIATLAYVWGYPLVTVAGSYAYYTTKGVPNLGEGPVNTINFARSLSNTSWVQYVSPNVNVLYGNAWMNLAKGPLVLLIPPIDRYYVMQFMDTFGQVFAYVGARATGSTGGTFLIAGPTWNGIVPNGMHEIKTPTNIAWISNRIFVNGTSDLPNVHAIQNQIKLVPLSVFQGNATSPVSPSLSSIQSAIKASDKTPNPAMIPAAGIRVYDAISQAMVGNPQTYPPPDPQLLAKFASIGIGPGKTPSKAAATNSTLNTALQAGVTEGEKLVNAKVANIGTPVNGWLLQTGSGTYGTTCCCCQIWIRWKCSRRSILSGSSDRFKWKDFNWRHQLYHSFYSCTDSSSQSKGILVYYNVQQHTTLGTKSNKPLLDWS